MNSAATAGTRWRRCCGPKTISPAPAWNSAATAGHPDAQAVVYEDIDITAAMAGLPLASEGANVLAIHGLNASLTSSDFLIAVELEAKSP